MSQDASASREIPLLMPKMSMTMENGEVLTWHAAEGDEIVKGDVLVEVMTDKVDMEVESPVDGVLARIVADPRSVIDVGAPMAFIRTESDDLMAGLFDEPDGGSEEGGKDGGEKDGGGQHTGAPPTEPADAAADPPPEPVATPPSRRGPQPAVPFARRRAGELGIALTTVTGSGPDGLIRVADVEQAASDAAGPAAPSSDEPVAGASGGLDPGFADQLDVRRRSVRAAAARTMSVSAGIPQFTVFADLDLQELQAARGGIGWTTLLIRGLARALRTVPALTSAWDERAGAPGAAPDEIGVAVAVDSPVGLLAPVVRDPDRRPLAELDSEVRRLVDRARTGRLSTADLQGATTTLSNLGSFGVPSFTSLLTPPQASALSVGAIGWRPVARGGGLAVRIGSTVGLTVDHRSVDGADAARLLAELRSQFVDCERLLG